MPNCGEKAEILRTLLPPNNQISDSSIRLLATQLPLNTTGADISGLVTSAQLNAIHERSRQEDASQQHITHININHLHKALESMKPALGIQVSTTSLSILYTCRNLGTTEISLQICRISIPNGS